MASHVASYHVTLMHYRIINNEQVHRKVKRNCRNTRKNCKNLEIYYVVIDEAMLDLMSLSLREDDNGENLEEM